jgi:breast cancer 2 susceptibility protein
LASDSYERDLNRVQRPIIRLILERDAPPGRPMVLVVSGISWTPQQMDPEGNVLVLPHPTFELTDGWYRVRAEVDEALARAGRRRKIRLGTKLMIIGARVCTSVILTDPCATNSALSLS